MIIKKNILYDIILSLILEVIIIIIFYILFKDIFIVSNLIFNNKEIYIVIINLLISTLGIFGVIITLFTIFEEIYAKNKIIIILKKTNTYSQIFEKYIDSIIVWFFSIIIIFSFYILYDIIPSYLINYLNIIKLIVLIICFIRIYRCLELFLNYKNALKNNSN